ncbi:MAG: phosphatase PAP2 family protein [Thermoguttaceae bacterium]
MMTLFTRIFFARTIFIKVIAGIICCGVMTTEIAAQMLPARVSMQTIYNEANWRATVMQKDSQENSVILPVQYMNPYSQFSASSTYPNPAFSAENSSFPPYSSQQISPYLPDSSPILASPPSQLPASPLQMSPLASPTCFDSLKMMGKSGRERVFSDYKNLYNLDNALNFGVALSGGAILANTSMDQNFRNWYQKDVRSSGTNDFAKACKIFGEGSYMLPITITSALFYRYWQERKYPSYSSYRSNLYEKNQVGEFMSRTARGYVVGAPTLLLGQFILGGDRPTSGSDHGSYWKPFQQDHGISGHAFIGAMPFITAAQMTDKIWIKSIFYTLSTLPGWSRINDDAHYLSQVVLGWYLAYLSARAISETESGGQKLPKGLTIFPITGYDSVGFGVQYRR